MQVVYKNLDEQLTMIKEKNILFKNEERAKEILLRENYYNLITLYKDIFINIKRTKIEGEDVCCNETYFEELYAVYQFDRELRNKMFHAISIIETMIKSYIANFFAEKYGVRNYLRKENFYVPYEKEASFREFVRIIKNTVERNLEFDKKIKSFKLQTGIVPPWMLTTLITFGNMVNFYQFMKKEDQKEIAKHFNMNETSLLISLKIFNIIRNISAHNNLLFNVHLRVRYPIKGNYLYHEQLKIKKNGTTYEHGIQDLLAVLLLLKNMLPKEDYRKLEKGIKQDILLVKKELDEESFWNFLLEMGITKEMTSCVM